MSNSYIDEEIKDNEFDDIEDIDDLLDNPSEQIQKETIKQNGSVGKQNQNDSLEYKQKSNRNDSGRQKSNRDSFMINNDSLNKLNYNKIDLNGK